jgi:hypothetical protein
MKTPLSANRIPAAAALLVLLGASGCVMDQSYDARVTTAEGEVIDVPMTPHPIDVSDGVVRVFLFQFAPVTLPDGAKRLAIKCEAGFAGGARPASILVRDITEAPVMTVFDVRDPVLADGKNWIDETAALGPSDDLIRFMANIDNSIRIYRFTFTLVGGSVHVLTVPIIVPGILKEVIEKSFSG